MGFSAIWFSHYCHLNHEEFKKMFLKIHKTFKGLRSMTVSLLGHIQFMIYHIDSFVLSE